MLLYVRRSARQLLVQKGNFELWYEAAPCSSASPFSDLLTCPVMQAAAAAAAVELMLQSRDSFQGRLDGFG